MQAGKDVRTHAHKDAHTHAHTQARTHAHTQARTQAIASFLKPSSEEVAVFQRETTAATIPSVGMHDGCVRNL